MEITKDILIGASDYLTNAQKDTFCDNAEKCLDRLAITADGEEMPAMYAVNNGVKARYLMGALATYLGQKYEAEENDAALMTEAEYDRWAGSHPFNQIERWKRDKDVHDKCYDLMADYKELEKRFSSRIAGVLTVQNDVMIRQATYSAKQMKAELPRVLSEMKALSEQREEGDDGGK